MEELGCDSGMPEMETSLYDTVTHEVSFPIWNTTVYWLWCFFHSSVDSLSASQESIGLSKISFFTPAR